jgi:hypothetical protein
MLLSMWQRSRFLCKQQARLGGTADAPYVLTVEFAEIIGLILSGRCPLRVHAAPCLCACVCVRTVGSATPDQMVCFAQAIVKVS